jgi:hypothetical protein
MKIHAFTDALLLLTSAGAEALLGDKGYDSNAFVQAFEARGIQSVFRFAPTGCAACLRLVC